MNRALNILLVDDREQNLLALQSLLQSSFKNENLKLFTATKAVEAMDLLLEHDFALALLDVQMPEMDGFELAEHMRGIKLTRSVPIIFITAGGRDTAVSFKGYEKGAVDFLYKPLDPFVVKCKVQIFLDLARQRHLLEIQLEETLKALSERDQALSGMAEALQTRDEFISIASHELKTPLTSMQLQLQLLEKYVKKIMPEEFVDSKVGQEKSDRIHKAGALALKQSLKLANLLEELLDLTRIRLGKLTLRVSEFSLTALTHEIIDKFKPQSEQNSTAITFESDREFIGQWDETRIEQVLTNLVSNAIKYGDSKPIKVSLKALQQGKEVSICVEDQGLGIPDEMQDAIFQRFERAAAGSKISGLGLGLYITRQIVEAHHGRIAVESHIKKGSKFTVTLPTQTVTA